MNKVKEFMDNCPSAELWLDENEDKWTRDDEDHIVFLIPEEEVPFSVKQYADVENFTVDEMVRILAKHNKYGG